MSHPLRFSKPWNALVRGLDPPPTLSLSRQAWEEQGLAQGQGLAQQQTVSFWTFGKHKGVGWTSSPHPLSKAHSRFATAGPTFRPLACTMDATPFSSAANKLANVGYVP